MSGSILEAAAKGDVEALKAHLANGVAVDTRYPTDGSTPLHIACRYGQLNAVTFLLQNYANPNDQNNTGNTPLHMAVAYLNLPIVKVLIQFGAMAGAANNEGKLPRDYAKDPSLQNFLNAVAERQAQQKAQQAQLQSQASSAYQTMPSPSTTSDNRAAAHSSPTMQPSPVNVYQTSGAAPAADLTQAQIKRMEEERKQMALKVRERFAQLVQEKNSLQEKCEQLERQLAMGGKSGDANVDSLREQVVQLQSQVEKMTEARVELERKVREKIAKIVEEKNQALDKLKAMEATAGVGAEVEGVRERIAYLVNENDKYMAKISDLENQLNAARQSKAQLEQYFKAQLVSAQAETRRAQEDLVKVRAFAVQANQEKQTAVQQLMSLTERKNRLETAVGELYSRVKSKEQRIVELEAHVDMEKVGSKSVNEDLIRKTAELTGELDQLKIEHNNAKREVTCLAAEKDRLSEDLANSLSSNKAMEDRVKTLEMDLMNAQKELATLRDSSLKMAQKETTSAEGEAGDASKEDDEDEKAGRLVLVRSDTGNPQIRGGTPKVLVKRLTLQKYPDPEYMPAFLLTYRSFLSPDEFLDELMAQYTQQPPSHMSEDERMDYTETIIKPVHLRVFNVLKNWVEKHYYDFQRNPDLKKKLVSFIDTTMKGSDPSMSKLAGNLSRTIEKREAGDEGDGSVAIRTQPPPKAMMPKMLTIGSVTFNDLHPLEIARHLTMIEFDLFKEIRPTELMGQAWNKKEKEKRAPNIVRMIHRFNEVGNWVTTEIVQQTDNIKNRVAVLEKFIKICQHLRELNNFNGVMELVAGLQSSAVHRLKKTWAGLKDKSVKKFEEMRDLMSNRGSYKEFRDALHHAEPPCIPYLGVYLTDLTFIEDGNPDWLNEDAQLVNFNKRRKVASVIREISQFQMAPYVFEEIPAITDYLKTRPSLNEEDAYNQSLLAEPRSNV